MSSVAADLERTVAEQLKVACANLRTYTSATCSLCLISAIKHVNDKLGPDKAARALNGATESNMVFHASAPSRRSNQQGPSSWQQADPCCFFLCLRDNNKQGQNPHHSCSSVLDATVNMEHLTKPKLI